MKTPQFWQNKSMVSNLLLPIGRLYSLATRLRIALVKPRKISRPVICIGNLTAGGTGKTPVAVSVAKLLQTQGKNPFFVSRGYGGELKGVLVNNSLHTAAEVGDEPLLLSRQAPVIVNPDRYQGAVKALKSGAELIIMDDGFQNPGLKKDLSFLVFDGGFGIGNGFPVPAGPLREDFRQGLKRADAVIILGEDKQDLYRRIPDLPVFHGKVIPEAVELSNKNAIAFAGIGRPEKFYQSMRDSGFNLVETIDFPDHHQYSEDELNRLIAKGKKSGAKIFTTSKDFVKIPHYLQKHFQVLEISIKWEEPEKLLRFILSKLKF